MLKPIIIAGYKKSGKTQLIEELVQELRDRGYRVGTVKHVPGEDFTLDQSETDTWKHAQAGANPVIAVSPNEVAKIEKKSQDLEEVLSRLDDLDFVLIEGFHKAEKIPKIIITQDEEEAEELNDEFTIGFVGKGIEEKPILNKNKINSIVDLIEEKAIPLVGGLNCGECGYDNCNEFVIAAINGEAPKNGCKPIQGPVKLKVDGKRIPLKSFVKGLIASSVSGMVSSLKGVEEGKIELEVEKDEG
ncbi:MAG: molybdopterin-guanine dinucleotide biosynthesis protein B [Hadesarchaea archaeon]|nr:molybdopterin-guanine dinucleotide biosynthesis protein B [Hadesarchaea archaeon]